MEFNSILEKLITFAFNAGRSILGAIIIYIIGRFINKHIKKFVGKLLEKRKVEASVQSFVKSAVGILLNIIIVYAIIARLGVETTSIAALLASAGVAIGMAMSGNLSNFAGGLIVLMFKPFRVGDFIEGSGVSGTVQEIQIFHTILDTPDGRVVYVPNGSLSGSSIVNYSKKEVRRVDFTIGVEYNENFDRVKAVLQSILDADKRVLKTPASTIEIGALSASSVDITLRFWVKSSDYWDTFFSMNKTVYERFNEEKIGFPFPQITVHKA